MPKLLLLLVAIPIAVWFGGWPWALLYVLYWALLLSSGQSLVSVFTASLPGFFWLWAFQYSADRRMFFPFAIHFAVLLSTRNHPSAPILAPAAMLALFSAIRLWQNASLIVLAVELVVALFAVAIPSFVWHRTKSAPWLTIPAAMLGAGIAYWGLRF